MPFVLNFFHDQVAAGGSSVPALLAAHRLLYVRYDRVVINGQTLNPDEATYCEGPVALQSAADWSQVWRWELAVPNAAPLLLDGSGVLSSLRMSRVITHLAMLDGSCWLFRLDQITSAAGRIADRHQHPGPGIRCLLEGTFNVAQDAESARTLFPGDAWWETGPVQWLPGGRARWRQSSSKVQSRGDFALWKRKDDANRDVPKGPELEVSLNGYIVRTWRQVHCVNDPCKPSPILASAVSSGGRPTDRDRIVEEARRRINSRLPLPQTLAAFARELHQWLEQQPNPVRSPISNAVMNVRTIEDHVRPIWTRTS
jgi:hypothetical protein